MMIPAGKSIDAGLDWEMQGYDAYDGFAWYRQKVFIPSSMKKQKLSEMGGLVLYLGRIDDVDVTYLNGQVLGQNRVKCPLNILQLTAL